MTTFLIFDEVSGEEVREESDSMSNAVEMYVHHHHEDDWSDRFDVQVRREGDDHWTIYAVTAETTLTVNARRPRDGGPVSPEAAR